MLIAKPQQSAHSTSDAALQPDYGAWGQWWSMTRLADAYLRVKATGTL